MDWNNIEFDYMAGDRVVTSVRITNGVIDFENKMRELSPVLNLFGVRGSASMADLKRSLSYMVFNENRADKNKILEYLGLDSYNVFRIVEKTHGVMVNKIFWIRFRGEENLTCSEVRKLNGLL